MPQLVMTSDAAGNSRRRRNRRHLAARVATTLAAIAATAVHAQLLPERPMPFGELRRAFPPVSVIAVGARACHRLDTLLADTPARRARGLMFVESMPDDAGMLFIHDQPAPLSMWMKNTLIPLDMLFADGDGRVINIESGKPLSTASIRSAAPARYVLELNRGRAAALGLAPGALLIVDSVDRAAGG